MAANRAQQQDLPGGLYKLPRQTAVMAKCGLGQIGAFGQSSERTG
jgi:hypothetical protein